MLQVLFILACTTTPTETGGRVAICKAYASAPIPAETCEKRRAKAVEIMKSLPEASVTEVSCNPTNDPA